MIIHFESESARAARMPTPELALQSKQKRGEGGEASIRLKKGERNARGSGRKSKAAMLGDAVGRSSSNCTMSNIAVLSSWSGLSAGW